MRKSFFSMHKQIAMAETQCRSATAMSLRNASSRFSLMTIDNRDNREQLLI